MGKGAFQLPAVIANRWLQLFAGVACMVMIANLQYGWTLFVQPIDAKYGWGRPAIQVAFSIFVITEAWLVPLEGWFVDRFGPRIMVVPGGLLIGAALVVIARADSTCAGRWSRPDSVLPESWRPLSSRPEGTDFDNPANEPMRFMDAFLVRRDPE